MKLLLPFALAMAAGGILASSSLFRTAPPPAIAPEVAPRDAGDLTRVAEVELVRPAQVASAPPAPAPAPVQPGDPMGRYLAMDRPTLEAERAGVAARQASAAARVLAGRLELGLFAELKLPAGESPATPEVDARGLRCFHATRLEKTEGGRSLWHVASLTLPEAPELQADQELLQWMDWRLQQLPR